MLRINTISRPVFFMRDDKIMETNNTGEHITTEEFATLSCEMEVICVDDITGDRYIYTPKPVVYITAVESQALPTKNTPATDAGRVPTDLPVGSKSAKA
jgi:hypothetical protein